MVEAAEQLYNNLVHKAYIHPIKSILAVDDEYASLDTLLKRQRDQNTGVIGFDIDRQIATLDLARENNWLIDMLDTPTQESQSLALSRLHQSDLVLIDYHLDSAQPADPTLALNFLAALNSNHHFNLIIVYTKEEDLSKVQREIFRTLAPQLVFDGVTPEITSKVESWIVDGHDIFNVLIDTITDADILNFFRSKSLADLKLVLDPVWDGEEAKPENLTPDELNSLYLFALNKKIQNKADDGAYQGASPIKVSGTEGPIWIKTDRAFIAIASKNVIAPIDLLSTLNDALCDWGPTSHRLLLAKIKSEIDDNGQTFDNQVLRCEYTNAGWLKELLESNEGSYKTLTRLMEGLTHALGQNADIEEFASQIKEHVNNIGIGNAISKETSSRVEVPKHDKEILISLNAHICSLQPGGNHLHPGHIIEWIEGETVEYWICLTPFCDLVPEQQNNNWSASLGSYIPVKFVKLHSHEDYFGNKNDKNKLKILRDEVTRKNHLFISIDGVAQGFSVVADKKTPPHWEQWFAANKGKVYRDNELPHVTLIRTRLDDFSSGFLSYSKECRIVGHLRYEYALNLISMLGENLTRIGLDFTKNENI